MSLFLAVVSAAGIVLVGSSAQAAQAPSEYGTRYRPLSDVRYETMRALARYVDETAQGALEGATDDLRHGKSGEARFLSSIRSFARSAHDFRLLVDAYETTPFDVPSQVADLQERARLVSDSVRSARAVKGMYGEWEAMTEALHRMTLLLAGREIEVPADYVVPALSGPGLEEFRQLTSDLDVSTARAYETARREVGEYPDRGRQFLGELQYFAGQGRDLHARADADDVSPQQIGPIVDRLLDQARRADRTMREAEVFTEVWHDSGRTITILQRMARLVRSVTATEPSAPRMSRRLPGV
jgi:hypothetical protein